MLKRCSRALVLINIVGRSEFVQHLADFVFCTHPQQTSLSANKHTTGTGQLNETNSTTRAKRQNWLTDDEFKASPL